MGFNLNLGAFFRNLFIFTLLKCMKLGIMHYSALGGVVFKRRAQYEPIQYINYTTSNCQYSVEIKLGHATSTFLHNEKKRGGAAAAIDLL